MIRDIHAFVQGNTDWEEGIELISRVAGSEKWIDYLL